MRRTVSVQLHRRHGKKLHSITVRIHQVTLAGFIECLRAAGTKVNEFRFKVKRGAALTDRDAILAMGHPDVCCAIADVLCPEQPRDWYRAWHSIRNVQKMLEGARQTSDWGRLIAQLDFSGKKKPRKGGSLHGDAILLGRMLGVNPAEILYDWPMEHFLDTCDAVLAEKATADETALLDDPTMDPNAKPTPLIAGMGKQWIN